MRSSKISFMLVVVLVLAALLGGCWNPGVIGSFGTTAPGPQLTVTPPEQLVGGQFARWVFSWTKGAGPPYSLFVYMQGQQQEVIRWSEDEISGRRVEHDFTLTNSGNASEAYYVEVHLSDRLGLTGGIINLFPTYDGTDSTTFTVQVQPAP